MLCVTELINEYNMQECPPLMHVPFILNAAF
jgi:hypothetical protein